MMTMPTSRNRTPLAMERPAMKARGYDCKHEVHAVETPQCTPVAAYFMKAGAGLVEVNKAIDTELGRKDRSGGEHEIGDGFTWPRESDEEEQRNAEANEQYHRRLGVPESSACRLTEQARGENEGSGEHEQLARTPQRGQAVYVRQYDQVESQHGNTQHQVGQRPAQ